MRTKTQRNLLTMLSFLRIFFLVLVVFATTALYIYAQNIYHSKNWVEAIFVQELITWFVVGGSIVIIGAYIWLEIWAHKQDEKEKDATDKKLDGIITSQNELNRNIKELIDELRRDRNERNNSIHGNDKV
jgi:type VI protein secretion system component VasK